MKDGLYKREMVRYSSMSFGGGKRWRLFAFSCGRKTDRVTNQTLKDISPIVSGEKELKLPLEYML
jgi:hypothetical protein|tara:strand:+ start:42192 stop:42386 length:195 start_codon:yes stop_codon:yes gene_type:complete